MASPTSNYNSSDSLDSIMTDTALSELLPITFNFQPQYSTQVRSKNLYWNDRILFYILTLKQ